MKFFKNRFIALVLSVLIIFFSSVLSLKINFEKEFAKVRDDFYNGVVVNGTREVSIYSQLTVIGRAAEKIAGVAERNNVDTEYFKYDVEYFNHDILTAHDNISYIHFLYNDMLDNIMSVGDALSAVELSAGDEEIVVKALEEIITAKDIIENSSYNERVRQYISSLQFPMDILADLFGTQYLEYFA